ncbi:glycoside hydrolase family 13 protein [Lactiplantibacillus modestisalitolerans]|uniref:Glycoside hydrolase family 13 protein n=1 Tax=Lactiplantibacillus modestisalitolerans TaxID=1457219 RepID=A0ABV5WSI0_9LACO|nr:glycoside hydrolase family 13 protein [Lactiplantibacillus modestisalitolerans]
MQIKYDSFSTAYKQPFGAVCRKTRLRFHLQVGAQAPVTAVALCIVQDGQWTHEQVVAMHVTAPNRYTASFSPTVSGLYFYYFRVATAMDTVYYGCRNGGLGGVGVQYADRQQVQMYQLTVLKSHDPLPEWYRHGVGYQIFVDRFCNGNPDGHVNAPKPNSFLYGHLTDRPMYIRNADHQVLRWDFYGGNLRGITEKLPYLQALGVTILYLTPIFKAASNHRYDTGDFMKIDPVLGTLADFDQLVTALHRAGMHLILDGVFDHVGVDSRYFNQAGHYDTIGAAQSRTSPYYPWFTFKSYPNDYESWWGVQDLPTVDKTNASYRQFIYGGTDSVIDYWTRRGVDGWRLDVADELPDDFIAGIRQTLDHYPDRVLIGEVWEDASHKIAYGKRRHYLEGGGLQAVMNYPLRQLIINVLSGSLTPADWWGQLMTLKENYPRSTFRFNFNNLGSHDTPRILTMLQNDRQRLRLAFQLLLTLPGVPCLYYGDEAGMTGGKDPDNRAFFPWWHVDAGLLRFVTDWIHWRRQHPWLTTAAFRPFYLGTYGIGYCYWQADHCVLIAVNVSATAHSVTAADLHLAGLPANVATSVQQHLVAQSLTVNQCKIVENFT